MANLDNLAAALGIHTKYTNIYGSQVPLKALTRDKLLTAMGMDIGNDLSDEGIEQQLADYQNTPWLRPLSSCTIVNSGSLDQSVSLILRQCDGHRELNVSISNREGEKFQQQLNTEHCQQQDKRHINGVDYIKYAIPLPTELNIGYWQLEITTKQEVYSSELIVCPQTCYQPSFLEHKRVWGIAAQIYSLRSDTDWGIGTFSELKTLVKESALNGCDSIGINPIHPLYWSAPEHCSPYSPSSRQFINPIYIDVALVPGYESHDKVQEIAHSEQVKTLREQSLIDYEGVTAIKDAALTLLFNQFIGSEDRHQINRFQAFCKQQGQQLDKFATYSAIFEHQFNEHEQFGWSQWPETLQCPNQQAVNTFQQEHKTRIVYFKFLQWLAHEQLQAVVNQAQQSMAVGLYLDLAVGCHDAGAEVWSQPQQFVLGASVGAPPDALSALGQSWGLPPVNPHYMANSGYHSFRTMLQQNMKYAGALRIDHILGYLRQFWVAEGESALDGAYVSYPMDALFSIIALESHLNQCIVIGEDLGTVPEGFSEQLQAYGILSYKVLFFERWQSGLFKQPSIYPAEAMVTVSTHDLAPLKGWWQGNDLMWREQLSLYPNQEMMNTHQQDRIDDRQMLLDAMLYEKVLCHNNVPTQSPALINDAFNRAVQSFLAKSPCKLQMVPLEDLLSLQDQVNIPGTTTEHPNWCRKIPLVTTKIWHSANTKDMANSINHYRSDGNSEIHKKQA